MKEELKEIEKAFKEDNKYWNLELPVLTSDFDEFELPGAFGYSFCKYVTENGLEFIDFKTAHRMSSDNYIRYNIKGDYIEPLTQVVEQTNKFIT